jgi:CHAT domain-containing protein/Tfp pilus assembly protein PilF
VWAWWMATEATRIRRRTVTILLASTFLLATCRRAPVPAGEGLSQHDTEKELAAVEKKLRHEAPGNPPYWELTLRKAEMLEQLNRREEALAWLRKLPPAPQPPALSVRLIREKAAIENALGQLREADSDLLQAIQQARSSGQDKMAASLEVRRSRVLIKLDEPEKGDECLSRADDYVRESGDMWLVPYILHYRGQALMARNRFEDAIAPLEQSLAGFRRDNGGKALAANVVISLAWSYYRLGQVDRALGLYQEALATAAPEDRHMALGHLGNIWYEQRDFAKAAEYYRQAATGSKGYDHYYYAKWLDNLAIALIEQGKWSEAQPFNTEALKLETASSGELSPALVTAARIKIDQGDYAAAEKILRQAADSRRNIALSLGAYSAMADLYARRNDPGAVKREFESALALADQTSETLREDENKLSYLSSLIDVHRKYVDFLMGRGDTVGAFAVAESSRARLLRERLNLARSRIQDRRLTDFQAAAKASGATFLAYWIGPEHSYLWAISGNRFASYRLPPEAEIRRMVEAFQRAIESGGGLSSADIAAGTKLSEVLLPSAVLTRGDKYLIVPDGPLYALNFETLPLPGEKLHFWVEDATVAVAPSLDMLLERQTTPTRQRSLLLVGDAAEWNPEFPKLLHARQEMDGVARLFPAADQKVLSGPLATPATYERSKPEDYAFIHFTAHATANRNSPFDSAIILSRGDTSGKLSVKEVLSTRVHAELVTISACHSAGARTYWGEGLVGFAWAFLQSGAHGVIAGLWDVSDYSSPRLMHDLYAGLAASKNPAVALRDAKLELLRSGKYADPYYWGALQLYKGTL